MYNKLNALLLEKFPQARKDGLLHLARTLAIQVETDQEAQNLVQKLSQEKVSGFIKDWRSEMDSEISKSTKTFEENLKAKFNLTPKDTPTPPVPPTTDPNDVASIVAKAIAQYVTPLQNEIQSLRAVGTAHERKTALENALKDAPQALKNSYLKNFEKMNFETQDDFNAFIADTQNDVKNVAQSFISQGLSSFPRPQAGAASTPTQVNTDIEQWAAKNKSNS